MIECSQPMSDPPLPLLVTGIAGVAGYNAFDYFHSRYPGQVIGIRQKNNWPLTGPGIVACNAEDQDSLGRLFEQYQFKSVLNCAGNCALKSCELDSEMAWRINVDGVANLLAQVAGRARLVHLSIDLVFSGGGKETGEYTEQATPDPVTIYGKTMVVAEQLIAAADPKACILRISLPMGISFNGHAGAIDWIQSRFSHQRPATLYFDEIRTPTYTDCLNRLYHHSLSSEMAGIYHAGGPRKLSLFQIAQVINRIGGYDSQHLIGCPRIEAGPMPPRAGNVSLDSSKLERAIGFSPFTPWPLDEQHVPTDRDWHHRRTPAEPGSPELLAQVLYRNPARRSENIIRRA